MTKIWLLHQKQCSSKFLPLIFPIVFYHGKKPYDGCRTLLELIQGPAELIKDIFLKPFCLIDTHDLSDPALSDHGGAGILTFMHKHVYAKDILR